MKYTLLTILTLLLGCASQQTKIDRASRLLRANNSQLASLCAEQFPIRERFISGKEIIKADTISVDGIHMPCPSLPDQAPVFVKCPDGKNIIKTISKTDTLERENTAKIVDLFNRLKQEQDRRSIAEANRDKYRKRALVQSLISAFVTAVLVFSVFVRWKLR